jgi:small-conductance mechanosensitive channel
MKALHFTFRPLWLLLLLSLALTGAEIDTQLYEAPDKEAYYHQIQQQISASQKQGTLSQAQADEAKTELERLRQAAAPPAAFDKDAKAFFSSAPLSSKQAHRALQAAAAAQAESVGLQQHLQDVQSKLAFLKQTIDRLTADEKSRLLSYQLQFAYYKLQQKNLETKAQQLERYGDAIVSGLKKHLETLQCPETAADMDKAIAKAKADIEKSQQKKVEAAIALERAKLEGSKTLERLREKADAAAEEYGKQLQAKLALQSHAALCLLKKEDDKAFFTLLDDMERSAGQLDKEARRRYEAQDGILRTLAKAVFGVTTLVLGDTLHETQALISKFGERVSAPLFVFNERPISLLSLLKALTILIFGFFAGMMYKRWIARMAKRWPDMSQMSMRLASNIGYYLIVIVALIVAASSLGIDMTSISLIAGALSIGIGFGLQTVVSNFIAGIILMFERTIRIGDMIEISDVLRGRVTDMRIRSTTIKTFDNIDIVVPNSSFIQNNVINWTLEDPTRRLHIPFGVAYGTEVEAVKKAVLEELESSDLNFIRNDPDKKPDVWMVSMGSSSVDFELLVWVVWGNKLRPNALRSDFLILIYNALNKNGIQIPFPQLDLYVKQMPGPQE